MNGVPQSNNDLNSPKYVVLLRTQISLLFTLRFSLFVLKLYLSASSKPLIFNKFFSAPLKGHDTHDEVLPMSFDDDGNNNCVIILCF